MFFNEHAPPHFHAEYAQHRAVIDIRTLEVLEGKLPRPALELVLDWTELHRDELIRDWDLCQQHQGVWRVGVAMNSVAQAGLVHSYSLDGIGN